MKKITLLLLTLFCFCYGYSQFPQNFEDSSVTVPNGFPAGWLVTDNGVGTPPVLWTITNSSGAIISGTKSAFMNRQEIGQGNTSIDWLISPAALIPTNGQLRFTTKQSIAGDNGTIYQIRIFSGATQSSLASYTVLQEWTEPQMNQVFNVVEEKVVDFPAASFGSNVFIAFVRVYTQPTTAQGGDRWVVDDINVVQKCFPPTNLGANTIAATSANLLWSAPVGTTQFQLEVLPAALSATGVPTDLNVTGTNFLKTGLNQNTNYKYFVRSNCGNGNFSVWAGPFNFQTLAIGTTCSDPILVSVLPYQTINNTGNFGNTLLGPQTTTCLPGGVNYQSGNDVFYSYTATQTGVVSFTLAPTENRSSIFIYAGCTTLTQDCLAAVGNVNNSPRVINLSLTAGSTYTIVISSNAQAPTIGYNLLIQFEGCPNKPTNLLVANTTLTGADLSWTAPTGLIIGYQVEVQPQGSLVPAGAGEYAGITGTTFTPTDLLAGTLYQYWVRSECAPGVFSAWAGPILFNTQICDPTTQCTYIFRMTDSANNGWNNARMQIRQNGIVIATIGSTFLSGSGPIDVPVSLCPGNIIAGVDFDIFWSVAGLQPQQCIVTVINSFGQTLATINGANVTPGAIIYSSVANCTTPVCTIPPTGLTVSAITTVSGTVNWVAPGLAAALFDVFVIPIGQPAPIATTAPTYAGVPGFSLLLPGLLPDTEYDVYVRVQCNAPSNSAWSVKQSFRTLPTCPKPINQTVTGITTTTAVLGWTEAASATQWDVLLLAAPNAVVPVAPSITPVVGSQDIYIQGITGATTTSPTLLPATIYYYYVRAVCFGNDKSTWTGPFIFNTVTCADADKCQYRFLLTNTTNNNWNFGRMQVRQNGIVVANLGTGGINNPLGIPVMICDNAPFDLFWNIAGNLPEGIGVTVVNSFNDVVYQKLPGQGIPLTVLYADITLGNCTPPTCPKPTNLVVNVVGQTTANLGWTENGTASQWEIYAVADGATPQLPTNSSVLNTGVAGYYLATSNPFTIDGLTTGTRYRYFVRAVCSTTDFSTWTLLNPAPFITKPVNDECNLSTPVPVNPAQVCSQTVPGNTLGGTASVELSTCPGNENDDVWFSFVATNNIHIVSLLNVTGNTTAVRFAVYSGADVCSTMTQIFCSATNNNTAVLTNLIAGITYKIRVYTNGSDINQSASFNVCVSTPPPPAPNDECINAIPVTVNVLSECAFVTPGNLIGATGSVGVSNACVGTEDDDVWFSFTASSSTNVVSLLNVAGTTTNLNHGVYSGACGSLVQLYCGAANSLTSSNTTYVVGQTYYIRVWSNGATSEVVTFNVCVKPVSTCSNAAPFCGGTPQVPYVFPNTTGLPSTGQVACLFTTPNPTYFTLHVGQTGPLNFRMVQNTIINAAGQATGTNLDVDYVAWGPFTSTASCDQIVFGPCSPPCPNNTVNPSPYPIGNIVDCSYSGSFTETITIQNAQAGQFYIFLITNFSGQAGFISMVQTNASVPNSGTTICCDVDLGSDISICANSVTLNALQGVQDLNNVPVAFEWYLNNVLIPNETNSTLVVSASGNYKVKGNCGVNPVEDSIIVTLSPSIIIVAPQDYEVCDDVLVDGFAPFNLNTITAGVLGTLDPLTHSVSYYILQAEAIADATTSINLLNPFVNTVVNNQTIYIRVETNIGLTCSAVVAVNLVVVALENPEFSYAATSFCKNEIPNPQPIYASGGTSGIFTATPNGLVFVDAATGEINLAASASGSYNITNTIADSGPCAVPAFTINVVINAPVNASFTYTKTEYCLESSVILPIITGTAGSFVATPAGLSISASTGAINLGLSLPGTYTITNTVGANSPCIADVKTFTITLVQPANATITYNDPFCTSTSTSELVTITGTLGGLFSSTAGLAINATTGAISPSTSTPGTYTVTYRIDNANDCGIFTTTTQITVSDVIDMDFTQGCENNVYRLVAEPVSASFDITTLTFLWTGPSVIATNQPNAIILGANGVYTLTVTNADGCSATQSITVNNTSCTIQKGISPNNDGDNEFFDLRALNVKQLSIFNRYGTEVYKFGAYTNQWRGQSSSGDDLPDGTYFYIIQTVARDNISGWIFINR
jgi:gliding motility-associated-like protein